ncbi:hypothetical protein GUJ93_ZPchr0016g2595 [Zizania palustris]|uniref:Uncharacterized protein n=1 Tax=Zizania palustris TaxID=103762 RepID=A0A8J5TBC4_ZIZPA|nr:hypothetical protein GUJ93_ZPchr0016g2595 [Zizania palustris]
MKALGGHVRFFRSPASLPCLYASRSPPPHLSPPSARRSPPATPPPPPHLSSFLRALAPPVRGPCLLSRPIRVAPSPLASLAAPRRRSSSPSPERSGSELSTAPARASTTAGTRNSSATSSTRTCSLLHLCAYLNRLQFNFPKETAYHVRTLACSVARLDKGRILMEINYNACLWFN